MWASIGDHGVLSTRLSPAVAPLWIDRDLSWLDFNHRVLTEALDERIPLLERVKFLAIFTTNLDEFFMKRVALLREGYRRGPRIASGSRCATRSVPRYANRPAAMASSSPSLRATASCSVDGTI